MQDDSLVADVRFTDALYNLEAAVSSVIVAGTVERVSESESSAAERSETRGGAQLSPHSASLDASRSKLSEGSDRVLERETSSGHPRIHLNFSDIFTALRAVSGALTSRRVWLLLDEWGSVPREVQPMLAEFFVRCVLPLDTFTVKISAIEQETVFRAEVDGRLVGIEVGADAAADVNLDEFMVYEQNETRSREFFRGLMYKHLSAALTEMQVPLSLKSPSDVISMGFSDRRAFDELVRAAEGVPRDAINIAAKAGLRAKSGRISIPDVRAAARQWYQTDKEQAVRGRPAANHLLLYIIDEVIRQRRTRGFLVNQRWSDSELLLSLFESRVLHLVRKGYSAQDEPGERYDVWVIDYGAYVDLINTKNEPKLLLRDDSAVEDGSEVDVPIQDLRAIRRSILDLERFQQI